MKERPILFSSEMVRAILDGRKTQTRRVIKPQPPEGYDLYRFIGKWGEFENHIEPLGKYSIPCPYGVIGDQLWVKEKYALVPNGVGYDPGYVIRDPEWHWKSSLFMPRWASRITLEITGIRVERVQDITYLDCIAEGMNSNMPLNDRGEGSIEKDAYAHLWDKINKSRGYSWDSNPFVWCLSFRRIDDEIRKSDCT